MHSRLLHGGFDSLIDEHRRPGFDVIDFDGPGQGGARALHRQTLGEPVAEPLGDSGADHHDLDVFGKRVPGPGGVAIGVGNVNDKRAGQCPRDDTRRGPDHGDAAHVICSWRLRRPAARAPLACGSLTPSRSG